MGKTKTLGIRATPQLISELERLKAAFGFDSYSDMLASYSEFLTAIDRRICEIPEHPRTWTLEDIDRHLSVHGQNGDREDDEAAAKLFWRRVRQRFGEDGVEALRSRILENGNDTSRS